MTSTIVTLVSTLALTTPGLDSEAATGTGHAGSAPAQQAPSPDVQGMSPPPKAAPVVRDGVAEERMLSGRARMIRSGIVMSSGAGLMLVGSVLTLAMGRAPLPGDYKDIGAYEDDWQKHFRRSIAGTLVSGVGGLVCLGGAIAFTAGAIRYRRGKKHVERAAGRRITFRPTVDGFALSF